MEVSPSYCLYVNSLPLAVVQYVNSSNFPQLLSIQPSCSTSEADSRGMEGIQIATHKQAPQGLLHFLLHSLRFIGNSSLQLTSHISHPPSPPLPLEASPPAKQAAKQPAKRAAVPVKGVDWKHDSFIQCVIFDAIPPETSLVHLRFLLMQWLLPFANEPQLAAKQAGKRSGIER
jgi:hypothetical protein